MDQPIRTVPVMDPPMNEPIASPMFPTAKIDSLLTLKGFQVDSDSIRSQPIRGEMQFENQP